MPSSFSIFFSRQHLLVANLGDKGPVLRYDPASGQFIETFFTVERTDAQFGSIASAPFDLQRAPDGWVHVLTLNPSEVWRFREGTGAFGGVVVPSLQKPEDWRQASGIAVGPDGNLYISTNNAIFGAGSEVLRFDGKTGAPLGMFVPTKSSGLQAECIVFGPDDHLYTAGPDMAGILRFNGTTGAFMNTFVAEYPHGNLSFPRSLAFGPDGHLYALTTAPRQQPDTPQSSGEPDRILRYHGTTGALLGEFVSPSPELGRPIAIIFGPDGNLYVGTTNVVGKHGTGSIYTGRIRVYSGTSGVFLGVLDGSNQANLDYPISMTFARVPISIREIVFQSRIPRWMWALGLGLILGALAGRRAERR